MDAALFRSPALDARRRGQLGEPLLPSPLGQRALAVFAVLLIASAAALVTVVEVPRRATVRGYLAPTSGMVRLRAAAAATVAAVEVGEGDTVAAGDLLVRFALESSDGLSRREAWLRAPVAGRVLQITVRQGAVVRPAQSIIAILPQGATLEAVLLVPPRDAGMLRRGQEVVLRLDAFPYQRFGSQQARVARIAGSVLLPGESDAPITLSEPAFAVVATLDAQQVSGYGQRWPLRPDLTFEADLVFERTPLIQRLLDPLRALAGARG